MNIFLLGWQLSPDIVETALMEFGKMAEVHPQLDITTCSHMLADDGSVFAAVMHSPADAVGSREYVWQDDDEFISYDGVIFDRTGSFAAHKAGELARHWKDLPNTLDGQFVAARVKQKPATIEVMTDLLGYVQVYYCQRGYSWLISNSVRPLVRLCQAYDFDPLGVSMFLSQTWVWDDRTLRKDIRTIPAGQLWKFELGQDEPKKHIYCSAASLIPAYKKRLSHRQLKQLGENLIQPCHFLNETLGPLRCALTGGKDSRVVMSLLFNGGIQAKYFTGGDPQTSKDIEIARIITETLNLPHEIRDLTREDTSTQWEALCNRLIQQGEGMISLWQLPDVLNQLQQVERLTISLSGMGGEIARSHYYNPLEAMQRHRPEEIVQMMIDMLVYDYGGLILPEARNRSIIHMQKVIQEYFDQGISGLDVMDVFYAYQRCGRWAGSNRKKTCPVYDTFAPLCTRPFFKSAFMIPFSHRSCEWLHYQLIRLLAPQIAELSFDTGRAFPQSSWLNLLRWSLKRSVNKVRRFVRRRFPRRLDSGKTHRRPPEFGPSAWLEVKRDRMREICLDQRDSMLWDFVNRSLFEQIMSDSTDPAERQAYRLGIYGIVTLFYYAATEKRGG